MPESASDPWNVNLTGALYQPSWSGARSGVASVTVGAAVSYLNVTAFVAEFPARSVQVPVTCAAAPSGPEERSSGHELMPDVASDPWKRNVTGPLYQPAAFGSLVGVAVSTVGLVLS